MKRFSIYRSAWAAVAVAVLGGLVLAGCAGKVVKIEPRREAMDVQKTVFGKMPDGQQVDLYTLTNANGLKAEVITYGAILRSVEAPDRQGKSEKITLYLDTLEDYLAGHPHFGTVPGRYANRIGGAKFTLDGKEYKVSANEGPNQLHGGVKGFDKYVWTARPVRNGEAAGVELTLVSPDGQEGYPGTLTAKVTYWLTNNNELRMEYEAVTDKPTVVNLTNHAYWNLGGAGAGDVLGHVLVINGDRWLPVDAGKIPTGELRAVKGGPMDFTTPMPIGSRIAEVEGGYDHCWVLNKKPGEMSLAAKAYDPASGRTMEVLTTEPGVQLYTANGLSDSMKTKDFAYGKHHALCLETQHLPDSPNKPEFPTTTLRPGETYRTTTIHKFGVQ